MARSVTDLALFLDTMAGFCPRPPDFRGAVMSFGGRVGRPVVPKRVAWTADSAAGCRSIGRRGKSAPGRPGVLRNWDG